MDSFYDPRASDLRSADVRAAMYRASLTAPSTGPAACTAMLQRRLVRHGDEALISDGIDVVADADQDPNPRPETARRIWHGRARLCAGWLGDEGGDAAGGMPIQRPQPAYHRDVFRWPTR